jgi:hypothetical protein
VQQEFEFGHCERRNVPQKHGVYETGRIKELFDGVANPKSVINWIFRDDHSPLTQQFHVVPMAVSSVVTQWLQMDQLLQGRFWINIAEATGVHLIRS